MWCDLRTSRLYHPDNSEDIFLGGLKWILIPFQCSLGFKIVFSLSHCTILQLRFSSTDKCLPFYCLQNSILIHKQLHGQGIGRTCIKCSESYAFLRETSWKEPVRSFVISSMSETEQNAPSSPAPRTVCPQGAMPWNGWELVCPSLGT